MMLKRAIQNYELLQVLHDKLILTFLSLLLSGHLKIISFGFAISYSTLIEPITSKPCFFPLSVPYHPHYLYNEESKEPDLGYWGRNLDDTISPLKLTTYDTWRSSQTGSRKETISFMRSLIL